MELSGTALVTGGGRGIGANVARELAAAGMDVAVTGRTAEQVEAVAAEIGGRALVGDVSKRDDVERWFAELGPVDLLVANAGTGNRGVSWELDPEEWWEVFEVNVLGVHLCCSAAIPGMLERGSGRIVIVGSGVDAAGVRAAARPEARERRLRRARRPLSPRRAHRRRQARRAHRRGARARPAGDPAPARRGFQPIIENL